MYNILYLNLKYLAIYKSQRKPRKNITKEDINIIRRLLDQNKKNCERIKLLNIFLSTTKRLVKRSLESEFEDVSYFQSSSNKKEKSKSRITLIKSVISSTLTTNSKPTYAD